MRKNIHKETGNKKIIFLAVLLSAFAFLFFSSTAKADSPSVTVYYLLTSDNTPVIRGTVSDPGVSVSVVIIGYVDREATVAGDGSWSLQLEPGEALPDGFHAVGAASVIGGDVYSDSSAVYVSDDYPIEIYYESDEASLSTSLIVFPADYSYASEEEHFSLSFAAGTNVTKTGGGEFDISEWYAEGVDPNNERIIRKLRFGIPNVDLTFSNDVTIAFDVGSGYDGETLNIFWRSDGGDDGWEPMDAYCTVVGGSCSFETSHASYFAVSQYNSIAETEEGDVDNDDDDDDEEADIKSWKAYQYDNNNGVSCKTRVVLEIKGNHFKKNSKVKIGGTKAFSVEKKSKRELEAKFCLADLLKVKTDHKRTVSVTNPDTDREKAKKKINLDNIKYGKMTGDDFDSNTEEGTVNIQKALNSTGFLEEKYLTGYYGPITTNAVIEFQKEHNLPSTGYVGPLTKAVFEEELD